MFAIRAIRAASGEEGAKKGETRGRRGERRWKKRENNGGKTGWKGGEWEKGVLYFGYFVGASRETRQLKS